MRPVIHATTVLCVRLGEKVAMGADGQVTVDYAIMKRGARKVRLLRGNRVLAGFAGGAADGFALFSRFEEKLDATRGNLERAAVDLVKDWRSDRSLRRLDALLLVADDKRTFLLSGSGDLIEPDDGLAAIGSGGPIALAVARALIAHTPLAPPAIVAEALRIASTIDIYTNDQIVVEEL